MRDISEEFGLNYLIRKPSYTAGELAILAHEFLLQSPLTDKLTPELILSSFLVWLAKREQGEVRGR